jgi:hypothetical protein
MEGDGNRIGGRQEKKIVDKERKGEPKRNFIKRWGRRGGGGKGRNVYFEASCKERGLYKRPYASA